MQEKGFISEVKMNINEFIILNKQIKYVEIAIITGQSFNIPHEFVYRCVEILSQLPEIGIYFHYSCPAPHILCIQFNFNLPDIHYIYWTMSCMTGCFHTMLCFGQHFQITNNSYDIIIACLYRGTREEEEGGRRSCRKKKGFQRKSFYV